MSKRRNLTLAIDEDVLERARFVAARRRTTVSRLVREYLQSMAQQDEETKRAVERIKRRLADPPLAVGDRRWTRDELHER